MTVENIFIAGMEKCGTTALSEWMVTNGLAQDRVPGNKEPYLYASGDPRSAHWTASGLPLLDASVGYAGNPTAIRCMPEYDTHIVLCLRNQFERAWSSYKMKKLARVKDEPARKYWLSYQSGSGGRRVIHEWGVSDESIHRINKLHFPRRSHGFIEQYGNKELAHIETHDFASRIQYELGFYLSRRSFPLFSILSSSFFYFPLKNLMEKYQPCDVSVISVECLADAENRRRFVRGVFDKDVETPGIPFVFSSGGIEIDERKPDFNDPAFDLLRASFGYDLAQARALIAKTRFADGLLDNAALDRYLVAR